MPWASPAALSLTSRAHGGPGLAPGAPVRVLELGCGDGAHLVPVAWFRPELTALGVDVSEGALARARRTTDALGLGERLRFEARDLAALEVEPGSFDVVIAHGVYSWIDAERRAALRRVSARALREGGLAYVSFNAEPGWSVRGRVRDALVRGGVTTADEARARLAGLRALVPDEPADAWSALLAHELERAAASEEGYLLHEYLAPDNASFWLGDVARDFEAEGLVYAGDATFDRLEGHVDPRLRARVAAIGGDWRTQEEHVDLAGFRQLRAAVFAKGEVTAPPPRAALVEDAWIAGAVARRSDPFDLTEGVEEVFDGPKGRELRIRSATLKVALLLLADRYPRGTRLDALHAECRARLAPHGIPTRPIEDLAASLGRLHEEMQIELRLEDARLRVEPGERPRALALTRHEAAERDVLTTPTHAMLPLEPIDRAIVARLDGTRTLEALAAELAEDVAAGRLALEGAPSSAARARPAIEARLAVTVATMGWWGLFE